MRGDLGAISDERAHELLTLFAPAIESAVRTFAPSGARVGLETDDLRQFARLGVLDAALSHDGRALLTTWVKRNIRWHILRALKREDRPEEPLEEPQNIVNGENPEELMERLQLVGWIRCAVDTLDPRQGTILACQLQGESMRQVAASLGISAARVHQETQRAFVRIRRQAKRDHLDVGTSDS